MRGKLIGAAACVGMAALVFCGCGGKAANPKPMPERVAVESGERQLVTPADGDTIAIFDTSLGEIRAVLYPDAAPLTVYNFVGLARSGYYNNTIIWRSEYGFAVQGGDSAGTGTGGATIWNNNPLPLEENGSLRHYAGALCAAFAEEGGTGQFYFVTALPDSVDDAMQQDLTANGYTPEQVSAYAAAGGLPYLDNTDTVFGQIYSGMEVADAMACVDTVQADDPADPESPESKEKIETYRPTEEATITINSVTVTTYPGPAPVVAEGEGDAAAK